MKISNSQIQAIHSLLRKKDLIDVKYEYLEHWFNVKSTKDLTAEQADSMIVQLGGSPQNVNYTNLNYGKFDNSNLQHLKILNICKRLQWTKINPKTGIRIANIEALGKWIRERSAVKKPLMKYTKTELTGLINQLEAFELNTL